MQRRGRDTPSGSVSALGCGGREHSCSLGNIAAVVCSQRGGGEMQRGLAQREIHSGFVPWRARQKHRRAAARSAASKPSARLAALRSSQSSTNHARAHARTEAGRAHSGRSTPGLPHPARVGFVTAATLNAATHGPALAERWPNAGRTLAERCALPRFRPRRFRPRQQGSPAQSSPAQGSPVIAQVCSSTLHMTLLSAAPFCWASALLAHTRTHARSTRTHACPRRGRRGKDAEVGAHRP